MHVSSAIPVSGQLRGESGGRKLYTTSRSSAALLAELSAAAAQRLDLQPPVRLAVTESARALAVTFLREEVQKTCKFWLLTCWRLNLGS